MGATGGAEAGEVERAFAEAISRDGVGLFRVAQALLGSKAAAEALVDEVFAEARRGANSDADSLSRPALFGALRRKAVHAAERLRRSAEKRDTSSILDDVRPTEREALLLRYVGELSVADVARAAGVDDATARLRSSRGLGFLSRLSPGEGDEAPPSPEVAAQRRAVEETLAEILDGLASDAVSDFVASDDPSRDLVHDAERVVDAIRKLWLEEPFDATAALERIRAASVPLPPSSPETAGGRGVKDTGSAGAAPDTASAQGASSGRRGVRQRLVVVAGIATLGGVLALALTRDRDGAHYASAAWSGTVTSVSRAFGGGVGLERCSPDRAVCSPVDQGDDVPAGSTLRTDGQTRAAVLLHDGTRVVLDRDSELLLDGSSARRARLDHGSVVADVAELGTSRARFDLPQGFAETESVKVSFIADPARSDAEVARGALRLVDAGERGVAVHAGEVGRLAPGTTPLVFPSPSLGDRFGWTERDFSTRTPEEAIRGLGELGAKRPGDDHEKQGLVTLASHSTRVRIVGNVARTEVEEEFTSSSDDVLEGVFRFPLPPDAQIERLALDVDGKVEEGAFVDRDRASAIWRGAIVNAGAKKPEGEEIVWVPGPWRDPALLEWQRGGRFELRIYPIPRRASRKVLLAYTQVIPPSGGVRRYVYPLPTDPRGSTRIGRFDVDVEVRGNDAHGGVVARGYDLRQQGLPDGARQLSFTAQRFAPSGDLSIEYSLPDAEREVTAWAYRPGPDESSGAAMGTPGDGSAYVALALRPKLPRSQDGLERDFALVVDSSRSMYGERFRRATALAESIAREMDRGDRVTVLACDSTCRELPSGLLGAGPEAARAVAAFLQGVTPEGGSDVAAAVRRGRDVLGDAPRGAARVVYIGDGTPTIGPVAPAFIRREIEAAVPRDAGTVTAVAVGADADVATLSMIADAGGGVVVPYAPGQTLLDATYGLLGATYGTTLANPHVELPDGLVDVAPERLGTLRAGGETIVVARMAANAVDGALVLRGEIAGAPFEQRYPLHVEATTAKGNAFVPRLWAAAKIAVLEQRPDAESRRSAVELSGRYHVASRYTSLLVLESPAMMHAFGLEREERAALWTGDTASESTSAEGEEAVLDADDGHGALAERGVADKDADEGGAASSGAFHAAPERRARAAAPAGDDPSREEPAPAAAAPRTENKPKGEAYAYRDEFDGTPSKKAPYAPSVAPAPSPPPPLGTSGGGGLALQPRDEREEMSGPLLMQSPFSTPPARFGRRYVPMRKIWERVGHIVTPAAAPSAATASTILAAERDASGSDPSRESMRRLYVLYMLDGRVDLASAVAERWTAKDPLDPDALTARADVAAARGERDRAIRILGSVVDVRPGDHKAVFRLARLYRWAGSPDLACRHSMAAAEIRATDAKLLAEAVRCTRDLGHADIAADLMALADEPTRRAADALLAEKPADPSTLSGDLRLEATWDGGDDVDLALLPPDGARVSWLGAPTRAVITARDVHSTSREGLGLRGGAPGEYVVEVTRPAGHRGTVRGSVVVYAAGDRRVVPFDFDGTSARVALLKITTRPRLVPL